MKYRILQYLVCPSCRTGGFTVESHKERAMRVWASSFVTNTKLPEGVSMHKREEVDIQEGVLHCTHCKETYEIRDGIPRLIVDKGQSVEMSGHRLTQMDTLQDISAWSNTFDELQAPLTRTDFLGRRVLDIGCGYGRHTYFAAQYGAEVFAIDHSDDAVRMTKTNTQKFQHVHVIQADAANLPIKDTAMDRVFAFGVLHHTENPYEIMNEANRVLGSGGSLSVWVYGPRQGLTLLANNALRGMTTNMEHEELLKFSRVIARLVRIGSHTPYKVFHKLPIGHSIVSHIPLHDHHRWPFDIVVADIYDRLRFPVTQWFKGEELQAWFIEHGYLDCHVRRIVRNNETFAAMGVKR